MIIINYYDDSLPYQARKIFAMPGLAEKAMNYINLKLSYNNATSIYHIYIIITGGGVRSHVTIKMSYGSQCNCLIWCSTVSMEGLS